jgi:hypothetical protein
MLQGPRAALCGVGVVAALVFAATAGANPSTKEQAPPPPAVTFPAGTVCAFPVTFESVVNQLFFITFFDRENDFRFQIGAGYQILRVINETTHESMLINITGPGKVTAGADGSITIEGGGHWLVAFLPGDSPSSRLLLMDGRIMLNVSPAGKLTLVSHEGTAQDVCASLS